MSFKSSIRVKLCLFLWSRCSIEMWCPDDIGRDGWDSVGAPSGESMIQLPRVAWKLLACLKRSLSRLGYCCCCLSGRLFVCLSLRLCRSVGLSVSIGRSVCLSVSVCQSVGLSVCQCVGVSVCQCVGVLFLLS